MNEKTGWQEPSPSELENRLSKIVEPVVRSEGLVLLELELSGQGKGQVLRLYVDNPAGSRQGVSLEECVSISRQVGDVLDVEDILAQRYRLEVSSPGLDRKLKYAREFDFFAGRRARLLLRGEDKNYYLSGLLKGRQQDDVIFQVDGSTKAIPLSNIIRAQLEPEF